MLNLDALCLTSICFLFIDEIGLQQYNISSVIMHCWCLAPVLFQDYLKKATEALSCTSTTWNVGLFYWLYWYLHLLNLFVYSQIRADEENYINLMNAIPSVCLSRPTRLSGWRYGTTRYPRRSWLLRLNSRWRPASLTGGPNTSVWRRNSGKTTSTWPGA